MIERMDAKRKMAIQSMNGDGKINPALSSSLGNKDFGAASFDTKKYGTTSFGTKSAEQKAYVTKSFFGLKNPWFGRKVFDTPASSLTSRTARESQEQFKTDAFAVKQFEKATKGDLADSSATVTAEDQPRPYLVPGKTQQGIDKFTENLKKDLTIDDVRDLLNKGTDK